MESDKTTRDWAFNSQGTEGQDFGCSFTAIGEAGEDTRDCRRCALRKGEGRLVRELFLEMQRPPFLLRVCKTEISFSFCRVGAT